MELSNLFANLPEQLPEELFTTLVTTTTLRIERIVSTGHASPPDFWFDQEWHEFVLVISGSARLRFAHEADDRLLNRGDFLLIPAGQRHRVERTTAAEPTIWLAIHYTDSKAEETLVS